MTKTTQVGHVSHPILSVLTAIIAVALIVSSYIVLGPGPTAFAGGKRVALSAYQAQDPTGVPPEQMCIRDRSREGRREPR